MYKFNWVKLADCCQVVTGATPRRNQPRYWNGDIPWVTPKDLSKLNGQYIYSTPESITREGYNSCPTTILPTGSILLSSRAPIGLLAITGVEMCTNQGFKSLIPTEAIDSHYLFWCMKKYMPQLAHQGTGTTFKEVSKKIVENFEIPLPPIAQQKRIAAILDKADAVRRKRREAIRLTEELLRSTFLEMFGDPVTNSKKWQIVEFNQIRNGEIRNGLSPSSKGKFQSQVLTLASITQNKFNISAKKSGFFDREPTPEKTLDPKVFLICRGNGNLSLVGRGKFPDILCNDIFFPDTMIGVPIDQDQINPDFLEFLWNTRFIREQVESQARTTNGTHKINQDVVSKLKIFLPSIESQEKFGKIVKIAKKTAVFPFLEESENLFNSLLQRAFTGNL